MSAIVIRSFAGMMPATNPRLLDPGAATAAVNANMKDGTLRPFKAASTVHTPTKGGTKKTIYRFGQGTSSETQYWLTWTTDVDVVKAPIDNDTAERTIYTGDGTPKQTDSTLALGGGGTDYPNNAYRLGLPPPDISLSGFAVSGTPDNPDDPATSVAYVLTYVNHWGEESMPSGPSAVLTLKPGEVVDITSLPTAPAGAYNVTSKRLYRSSTGTQGTAYQLVTELNVATAIYTDSTAQDALGELIATWGWEQLPDGAKGLVLTANGIGAAFKENTVYLSVPFALYAYPAEYYQSTDSPVVGLAAFGQSIFVGTKANPYVITGVDPASMTPIKLDANQACVSKRSIVPMLGGVVYASPDGLQFVDNGGLRSLSDKLFTIEQWRAYVPSSFHAYEYNGMYLAFYDTGTVQGALVFDFATGKVFELSLTCSAAYNDPQQDRLFLAVGTVIQKFDAGSALTLRWRSGMFRSPRYVNAGYAKVEAEAYPLTLRLLSAGSTYFTKAVASREPFRVPRAQAVDMQFEVEGTSAISCVAFAETAREIEQA